VKNIREEGKRDAEGGTRDAEGGTRDAKKGRGTGAAGIIDFQSIGQGDKETGGQGDAC